MPTASRFSAVPETIWSARKVIANSACTRREHAAGDHADDQAEEPRAGDVRAPGAEERAHQHHALERDVDDARALGEEAAERAEGQRRGVAQRRGQQRAPDDDLLEVADARLRRREPPRRRARPRRSRRSRAASRRRGSASSPAVIASRPTSDDGIGVRTAIGGTAMKNARKPRPTPAQPRDRWPRRGGGARRRCSRLGLRAARRRRPPAKIARRFQHGQHDHVGETSRTTRPWIM